MGWLSLNLLSLARDSCSPCADPANGCVARPAAGESDCCNTAPSGVRAFSVLFMD